MRQIQRVLVFCLVCIWGLAACQQTTPTPPELSGPTSSSIKSPTQAKTVEASTEAIKPTNTAKPSPTLTPSIIPTATPIADVSGIDEAELAVIAAINGWRIKNKLPPLAFNETLSQVAHAQAAYLKSLPTIPNGEVMHQGPNGEWSMQRAAASGWPHYSTEVQTAVGEVACVNQSIDACIGWWLGSPPHYKILSSLSYREVGASLLQLNYAILIIVDEGSRPGVLPALLDPINHSLYLTSELYPLSGGGDWIQKVEKYQLLSGPTATPDEAAWQPFENKIDAPADGGDFSVAFSDGKVTVITEVRAANNVAMLPDLLAALYPTPTAEPTVTAAATQIASTPTGTVTTATASAPTLTPTAAALTPISISYTKTSLTITNQTKESMDLNPLVLSGSGQTLAATAWQSSMLSMPLDQFLGGGCIQASVNSSPDAGQPKSCKVRYSVIFVSAESAFWSLGDFDVLWNDQVIASCGVHNSFCEVTPP